MMPAKKISLRSYFSMEKSFGRWYDSIGMAKLRSDIETQLRQAILRAGISRYRLARESGIAESALSLFVHNKRTLTLTSAAKVAKALGLELRERDAR